MATRFAFVDDSNETRLAGSLVPEPVTDSGGTFTGPVQIAPTTYAPLGNALQVLAPPGETGGQPVLSVVDGDGSDVFDVDDDGSTSVTAKVKFAVSAVPSGTVMLRINGNESMGFFGATPVAQPVVPATPLPQDIVDALVALGLVSQSA